MKPSATAAVLAVIMCPLVGATTCEGQSATKACDVSYAGLHVENGLVVDTVTPVCDVPPLSHTMKAWIEFAVGDTWIAQGRTFVSSTIPDTTGYPALLSAPCQDGVYRTHVYVEGTGPNGTPFTFDDTSQEAQIALVQCAG